MTRTTTRYPSGAAPPGDTAAIAIDFLRLASSGHTRTAWRLYGSPDFVHHNPDVPSDAGSLISAMDENAEANPGEILQIKHTISQDPLVAIHSHVRRNAGDPGAATVHIFRIEGGRIRELWDVGQLVSTDTPNERGMF